MAEQERYASEAEVEMAVKALVMESGALMTFCKEPQELTWTCMSYINGNGCKDTCVARISAYQAEDGSFYIDRSHLHTHMSQADWTAAQEAQLLAAYGEDDEVEDDYRMDVDPSVTITSTHEASWNTPDLPASTFSTIHTPGSVHLCTSQAFVSEEADDARKQETTESSEVVGMDPSDTAHLPNPPISAEPVEHDAAYRSETLLPTVNMASSTTVAGEEREEGQGVEEDLPSQGEGYVTTEDKHMDLASRDGSEKAAPERTSHGSDVLLAIGNLDLTEWDLDKPEDEESHTAFGLPFSFDIPACAASTGNHDRPPGSPAVTAASHHNTDGERTSTHVETPTNPSAFNVTGNYTIDPAMLQRVPAASGVSSFEPMSAYPINSREATPIPQPPPFYPPSSSRSAMRLSDIAGMHSPPPQSTTTLDELMLDFTNSRRGSDSTSSEPATPIQHSIPWEASFQDYGSLPPLPNTDKSTRRSESLPDDIVGLINNVYDDERKCIRITTSSPVQPLGNTSAVPTRSSHPNAVPEVPASGFSEEPESIGMIQESGGTRMALLGEISSSTAPIKQPAIMNTSRPFRRWAEPQTHRISTSREEPGTKKCNHPRLCPETPAAVVQPVLPSAAIDKALEASATPACQTLESAILEKAGNEPLASGPQMENEATGSNTGPSTDLQDDDMPVDDKELATLSLTINPADIMKKPIKDAAVSPTTIDLSGGADILVSKSTGDLDDLDIPVPDASELIEDPGTAVFGIGDDNSTRSQSIAESVAVAECQRRQSTSDLLDSAGASEQVGFIRRSSPRKRNLTEPLPITTPMSNKTSAKKKKKQQKRVKSKKTEKENEESRTHEWCRCREGSQDSQGSMVSCANVDCTTNWYHTKCLDPERRPPSDVKFWFCEDCRPNKVSNDAEGEQQVEVEVAQGKDREETVENEEVVENAQEGSARTSIKQEEETVPEYSTDNNIFEQEDPVFNDVEFAGNSRASSPLSDVSMPASDEEGEDEDDIVDEDAAETTLSDTQGESFANSTADTSWEKSAAEAVKASPRRRKSERKSKTPARFASVVEQASAAPTSATKKNRKRKAPSKAKNTRAMPAVESKRRRLLSVEGVPVIWNSRSSQSHLEVLHNSDSDEDEDESDEESPYWDEEGAFDVARAAIKKEETIEEVIQQVTGQIAGSKATVQQPHIRNFGTAKSNRGTRANSARQSSATATALTLSITVPNASSSNWQRSLPTPPPSRGSPSPSEPAS